MGRNRIKSMVAMSNRGTGPISPAITGGRGVIALPRCRLPRLHPSTRAHGPWTAVCCFMYAKRSNYGRLRNGIYRVEADRGTNRRSEGRQDRVL